jgi:RNA polymerase II elongation factor ELL
MRGVQESTPHELYLRSALASKINAPLKLYADIAGKFTVERELNGKTESKVQQSTADAQKTKSERRIVLLDNPPALTPSATKSKSSAPPKKRKSAMSAPMAARRVPHVIRAKYEGSSAAHPQSPPHSLPPSQSSPVPSAMRAQMVHLLAKGPRTKEDVLSQVGGPNASDHLRVQLNELLVTVRSFSSYLPISFHRGVNSTDCGEGKTKCSDGGSRPSFTVYATSRVLEGSATIWLCRPK